MAFDTKFRPTRYADVLGQEAHSLVLRKFVERGKGFHQSYLFAGQHGSGKCVRGDTLVSTGRGLVPIESLMGDHQIDPLLLTVVQEQGLSKARFTYKGGVRDTLRIRTHHGFELEGTPNHRIRVMSPEGRIIWRALGDLTPDAFVCVPRTQTVFGSGADLSGFEYTESIPPGGFDSIPFDAPPTLTPEWGRLIGYLIGDGDCCSGNVVVSCAEPEIKQDLLDLMLRLCGSSKETPDKRRETLSAIRCLRKQPRAFLRYAGVEHCSAGDKVIPWSILASPAPVLREFLRGYFEADGSVGPGGIEITTKSHELARQVHVLLLQFGVVARRARKPHEVYGDFWRLCIKGPSYQTFQERLGFVSSRKQGTLAALVKQDHAKAGRLTNRWEVVPHQQHAVARVYDNIPKSRRDRETDAYFRCRRPGQGNCARSRVLRIASEFSGVDGAAHFVALAEADYFYDAVVLIQPGLTNEVFDLNVPDGEMFAANGFMNHNTTMGRILARSLLCENPVDGEPCDECMSCKDILEKGVSECFTELNAATQSGKGDILKVIEEIDYSTFAGKQRVYLFDEAHRLSKQALDALLKPLEDEQTDSENKRLVCIFCTTEPEKMVDTVWSRCAPTFTIKVCQPEVIATRLAWVCEQEGLDYEMEALVTISAIKTSHIRDALKAMESIALLGPITVASVRKVLQLDTHETLVKILLLLGSDLSAAIIAADKLVLEVSPTSCYERLAHTAMLAYKVSIGATRSPPYWREGLLEKLGDLHGDYLVVFAQCFSSRPGRPTASMLSLDLARLHQIRAGQTIMPTSQVTVGTTTAQNERVPTNGTSPTTEGFTNLSAGKVPPATPNPEEGFTPQSYETSTGRYIDPRGVKKKRGTTAKSSGDTGNPPLESDEFSLSLNRFLRELRGGGINRGSS